MSERSDHRPEAAERGFLFVSAGPQFVQEVMAAAHSCARHMPDVPRCIFVDNAEFVTDPKLFDHVEPYDGRAAQHNGRSYFYLGKLPHLIQSPFRKTIYLDSDVTVVEPCYELFDLLDAFDLAVSHAPVRSVHAVPECPDCFPELNVGVLAYNRTAGTRRLVEEWIRIYREQLTCPHPPSHEQPAFRLALYRSDVRFTVLPSEYNLRVVMPFLVGGNAKVKILHGRVADPQQIARQINDNVSLAPRIAQLPKPNP